MEITDGIIADAEALDSEERRKWEKHIAEAIEHFRIKACERYAEKNYLLERDGIGFAPRGNVCAISAEKKAGKTWFCMAMCAALLCGDFLGMKRRESKDKLLRVAFFDTEQDEGDGQRIQRRIHYANGWDFEIDHDEFQIFHLREVSQKERRQFVNDAIKYLKPDMVIVDGIRDLLQDFNDLQESASVIQDFMRISSELNCCIWAVLHVNPNSEKMRGHLGTELGNKVADILHLTKHKDSNNEDNVTYKMEETDARGHKDIHSITFRIDDFKPYGLPVLVGECEALANEENIRALLRAKFEKYIPKLGGLSYTKLRSEIKAGESIGTAKADRLIRDAISAEVIERAINGKYILIQKPLPKTEELPFEKPEEKDAF